jgi:uncharacterized protein (TIGR01777 family)
MEPQRFKILMTGSSGLIGNRLTAFFAGRGDTVVPLRRSKMDAGDIVWDPGNRKIEAHELEGFDAVIHLAGESIVGRWTAEKKERIRRSRVGGTRFLSETLAGLEKPPRVLLCASATGFYGDRGDEILTEGSPPGNSFLSKTCQDWESAAQPAAQRQIRVVNLRLGIVLSREGGALSKMLLPFRLGLGGSVGSGGQYWSWISLEDVLGIVQHMLSMETVHGPVNAVSPQPATNREFAKTLGRVLNRPAVFPMPTFAARLAFGPMADELLLASARVNPAKLFESRYRFRHPALENALADILGNH